MNFKIGLLAIFITGLSSKPLLTLKEIKDLTNVDTETAQEIFFELEMLSIIAGDHGGWPFYDSEHEDKMKYFYEAHEKKEVEEADTIHVAKAEGQNVRNEKLINRIDLIDMSRYNYFY